MFDVRKGWIRGALLRATGVVLLACSWLLMGWLFHAAAVRHPDDPSLAEFLAATAGFLCLTTGAGLIMLGDHVFDRVELSRRWARHPSHHRRRRDDSGSTLFSDIAPHPLDRGAFGGAQVIAIRPPGRIAALIEQRLDRPAARA